MANAAVTVQLAVMAPVAYTPVAVLSEPLQPVALAVYPVSGVTVNVVVLPWFTVRDAGLMDPLLPLTLAVAV